MLKGKKTLVCSSTLGWGYTWPGDPRIEENKKENEFINKLYAKESVEESVMFVYIEFDKFLESKEFNICNCILGKLDINKLDIATMISILINTKNLIDDKEQKVILNNRQKFYHKFCKKVNSSKIHGKREKKLLLMGLEE